MTHLFFRFYLGMILVLLVAMGILAFAARYRVDADFTSIIERELSGGARLARESLKATGGDELASLIELQNKLDCSVRTVAIERLGEEVQRLLSRGGDVLLHGNSELSVFIPMEDGAMALHLGPVSLAPGTIETDVILAIGALLVLAAISIAILLRSLARQLGLLEATASSISDGNLGARVDLKEIDSAKTLAQALNGMAERVEVLLRTQQELLQAVSHELRTPLSRIKFATDLIRTASDDQERELRLRSVDTATDDLDELVGELLRYVRLETSGIQPSLKRIELLPLAEELIWKLSLISNSTQFQIGPALQQDNVWVMADPKDISRALSNLLRNASRFANRRVVIEANVLPDGTVIDVDDDGPGIPASERVRVFEPFVRLEDSSRGAGLGLALVERIVANHSGTVAAIESPVGGCRIRTFWPTPDSSLSVLN